MITDQKINSIVGVYQIGTTKENTTQIGIGIKPNWFRRFFTWLFLGWKWISIEDLKK